MGTLVLELYWRHAPRTCKNFAELCRRGYYNGTRFHRIIRDFMVQGGDPTGTGERRDPTAPPGTAGSSLSCHGDTGTLSPAMGSSGPPSSVIGRPGPF